MTELIKTVWHYDDAVACVRVTLEHDKRYKITFVYRDPTDGKTETRMRDTLEDAMRTAYTFAGM